MSGKQTFITTLGFKAAMAVAIPMLVILAIASTIGGVTSYRSANLQLEKSVQNTVADDIGQMSEFLWQLDLDAVQSKLDAYVKFGQITGASVTDDTGLVLTAGSLGEDPQAYVVAYDLELQRNPGPLLLGVLTLETSRDDAWALARAQVLKFVAVALVTVMISIFLINRLLNRLVLSPIKNIADDLHQRPAEWSNFRINQERFPNTDELNELVASIHDMRDQILASQNQATRGQNRLVKAAEIAGLGYATSDLNADRFLECDERYAAMHQLSVEEMLKLSIKKDIVERMNHPEDLEKGRDVCKRILHGESLEDMARVRVSDGKYRYLKKIFIAKKMPDDQLGVVDIVAQDVTEIFAIREQLLQSQKMKSIGQLTGGVAHDFNNLLAIILGNLELLQDSLPGDVANEFIQPALEATVRGADLTRNMLSFARRASLLPQVLNLNDVVRNIKTWSSRALPANIDVKSSLLDGLWNVKCDPTSTESAILNLMLNARDAMPQGGELTFETANITFEKDDPRPDSRGLTPGRYVMLAVSDDGMGIPPDKIEIVFEPFYTSKPPGEGSGLGLSMVQGFVTQSGGTVLVQSEPGVATTFKLFFPALADVDQTAPTQGKAAPATVTKSARILVAEDEPDLAKIISTNLERHGYQVAVAGSGDLALDLFKSRGPFDLLLTDIVMPGEKQGPELAEALRRIKPSLPVVFMSGYAKTASGSENTLQPSDLRLSKPITSAKLIEAIEKALERGGV